MIKYSPKSDRAFDSKTGRFVKFSYARLSSKFRTEYEPILLREKVKQLEKGMIEKEKLIEQLKERGIPSKEWRLVILPSKDLSPIMMYAEMKSSISKYKYQKVMKEIDKQATSNKKFKVLRSLYDKHMGIE